MSEFRFRWPGSKREYRAGGAAAEYNERDARLEMGS
jgi:hypothetical protein